jgi:hypothetical protein
MFVDNVVLAEALETLSTVTESRWRLTYFIAGDRGTISNAEATFVAGQKAEGWKTAFVPLPPIGPEPTILPDPRDDPWTVKPAQEATLQAYLDQASRNVSASFTFPESWNPAVSAPPKSGPISRSIAKLTRLANAKYDEVFLLQKSRRSQAGRDGGGPDDGEGPRFAANGAEGNGGRGFGGAFDRDAMQERVQAEINKLPPAERTAAQKEADERRKFFESLRDLPPDERAVQIQNFMSQPANQDRFDQAQADRDARRSPEQRLSRAQGYLARKAAATNGAKP